MSHTYWESAVNDYLNNRSTLSPLRKDDLQAIHTINKQRLEQQQEAKQKQADMLAHRRRAAMQARKKAYWQSLAARFEAGLQRNQAQ